MLNLKKSVNYPTLLILLLFIILHISKKGNSEWINNIFFIRFDIFCEWTFKDFMNLFDDPKSMDPKSIEKFLYVPWFDAIKYWDIFSRDAFLWLYV